MTESFLDGKVTLYRGDCLEVLPTLDADSIDSCVTDPPYHLTSIVKRFGSTNAAPAQHGTDGAYARASRGFMGKQWDGGDIAFRPEIWAEMYRVLKPGAHLLAFSGTRTYHRMACAIEDAGFEIRDQIGWCYGSGFPKGHDVSKGIDRMAGARREIIGTNNNAKEGAGWQKECVGGKVERNGGVSITAPATEAAIQWQGWGTALKPAWEPICLARKPLSESSIAANVLKHGTGGINVDGCRVGTEKVSTHSRGANGAFPKRPTEKSAEESGRVADQRDGLDHSSRPGRFPANLIHDGSEEVLAGFPDAGGGYGVRCTSPNWGPASGNGGTMEVVGFGNSGSAARFFYTTKADTDDRLGSKHPTVKPIDLIQYLARLITPSGGTILDPFAGTGTCGEASWREGFHCVLIERESEYQADIVKRMKLCLAGPDTRRAASINQLPPDDLPMFGGGI